MKIDNYLLEEQDIRNIELKDRIDDKINTKLQIEYINLINKQSEKYNINYDILSTSENNKYILKREYNFYDGWQIFFIFGVFTEFPWLLMSYIIIFKEVKIEFSWFFVFLIIIGIVLISYGSKGFVVRRKIKKNFKELGIEIN